MILSAPRTRAQQLAELIESDIDERQLATGDPLGTIDEWRGRSGYARATVSEAIRMLVDRGVAEVRPGRGGGVFVARTGPVVRLRHTLLTVHGEAAAVADAIAVREALEPLVVADAAKLRTNDDILDLRRLLSRLEHAIDDRAAFMQANWALHERLAAIGPNRLLSAVYLSMLSLIRDSTTAHADDGNDGDYSRHRFTVHEALVDAVAAGDEAAAERAVAAHQAGERA